MNIRNGEQFKETLKSLVLEDPDKLDFFDGYRGARGDGDEIPPFVPNAETGAERKSASPAANRRRRYGYGMVAAAACFVVFLSVTILQSEPGLTGRLLSPENAPQTNEETSTQDTAEQAPAETGGAAHDTAEPDAAMSPVDPASDGGVRAIAPMADASATDSASGSGKTNPSAAGEATAGEVATGDSSATVDTDSAGVAVQSAPASYDVPTQEEKTDFTLIGAIVCAALFLFFFVKRKKSV